MNLTSYAAVRIAAGIALIALAYFLVSLAKDGGSPLGGPTPEPGRERVLAPIDAADIAVLESFPPQYMLHVVAGLPNGCARAAGYNVGRVGDTIRVLVYNTLPVGDVACTMIYGTYELNIPLGSDFRSGRDYVVEVNDRRLTLRAQ